MRATRSLAVSPQRRADLVALNEALTEFAEVEPRKSEVVELGHFGRLSVEGMARLLGVSPQTVMRDCNMAKLWQLRALLDAAGREPAEE